MTGCVAGEIEDGQDPGAADDVAASQGELTKLGDLRAISLGSGGSCVVRPDGAPRCWGYNSSGRVGNGGAYGNVLVPTALKGLASVGDIATGAYHSCAVVPGSGLVSCWGDGTYGELGNNSTYSSATPVVVSGITGAVAVSVGERFSCALLGNGNVMCWGINYHHQAGSGCGNLCLTPSLVGAGYGFVSIDSEYEHTCGLTAAGSVYCWGSSDYGESGSAGYDVGQPQYIGGVGSATAVAVGSYDSCAVGSGGDVRCWGRNRNGELGFTPDLSIHTSASIVPNVSGARALGVGDAHACAALSSGATKCWGTDYEGELGNGVVTAYLPAVTVSGGHVFDKIDVGALHTCGYTGLGQLFCWGDNYNGQLGDGNTYNASVPMAVTL